MLSQSIAPCDPENTFGLGARPAESGTASSGTDSEDEGAADDRPVTLTERAYVERLRQQVAAVPRGIRRQAEVASFFLQLLVYGEAGMMDGTPARTLALAALAASERVLGIDSELTVPAEAAPIVASLLWTWSMSYQQHNVLDGLAALATDASKRWEHPLCAAKSAGAACFRACVLTTSPSPFPSPPARAVSVLPSPTGASHRNDDFRNQGPSGLRR